MTYTCRPYIKGYYRNNAVPIICNRNINIYYIINNIYIYNIIKIKMYYNELMF